ncbi:ligand-binding sensor domain-containing protein [Taibaiella koreensis]|uniref:ligand-binding sensor domain-containing protein n=1 Tax=Taibaiella koreensis TaxID=1268548 RepID=UPI000E59AED0|nr:ATP-binding protein [Taibaiella koreensis]
MNRRLIFFPLLLMGLLVLCVLSFAGDGRGYYISRHLNGDNGLPQNSIKSIAPDDNGFIWLATESGLVRYDGRKLKVYNKGNINLRSSRFVFIMTGTQPGVLYAITDLWQIVEIRNSQAGQGKVSIVDLHQPFWPRNSFTRGKVGDFAFYHQEHGAGNDSIQYFIGDHHKAVLYGDHSLQWDHPGGTRYQLGFAADPDRFFICGNQLYYLKDLSAKGLLALNPEKATLCKWTSDAAINPALPLKLYLNDVTRQVFLLNGSMLYLIRAGQDKALHFQLLLDEPLLREKGVRSLYYNEKADRIYVGTAISGLYILQRRPFNAMVAPVDDQMENVFYGQMLWNDSSIVTGNGYIFSPHAPVRYVAHIGQHADQFGSAIQRYNDGTIFTGDAHSLFRLSPDGQTLLSSWPVSSPFLIFQGLGGMLWLGTTKGGIYSLQPDSNDAFLRQVAPLNEFITCVGQTNKDTLWVGTTFNLYRLSLKTKVWDTISPLTYKSIRSLHFTAPDELWITTYEDGLFLWRKGKVVHMPMDRNSYIKNAHCIMEDRKGFFWISTNNGLFQVARADLLRYADGRQAIVYYHHYTKEQGFNTNEFNGGGCVPCALRFNRDSSFSFPSLNGLVWFHPEQVYPVLPGGPVIVDAVQIDGKDVPVADTLFPGNASGRINLWIATAFEGNADNLNMEYMIEGPGAEEKIWNPLINDFISFNSPGSGSFLITIRKHSGFGKDNYTYKRVLIVVPRAFWETWWFILFLVLGTSAIILLLIKARVNWLEKKNKELEQTVSLRTKELRDAIGMLQDTQEDLSKEVKFQQRLNASITHDIKTPIQYLTLSLKYLAQKKERQGDPDANDIFEIFQASAHISHFTHSLTGYIKVRLGIGKPGITGLHEIAARKLVMFSDAAAKAHIGLRNTIPESLQLVTHAALIDLILHNLIDNAIKHSHSGSITLSAHKHDEQVALSVEDTGKGMTGEQVTLLNQFLNEKNAGPENAAVGLGYFTIADTLELLKGHITVHSREGEGTRVDIVLPLAL